MWARCLRLHGTKLVRKKNKHMEFTIGFEVDTAAPPTETRLYCMMHVDSLRRMAGRSLRRSKVELRERKRKPEKSGLELDPEGLSP